MIKILNPRKILLWLNNDAMNLCALKFFLKNDTENLLSCIKEFFLVFVPCKEKLSECQRPVERKTIINMLSDGKIQPKCAERILHIGTT